MDEQSDLVWGAEGIKQALGLKTAAQVYTIVRTGHLDGVVHRVGRRLCASRKLLIQRIEPRSAVVHPRY